MANYNDLIKAVQENRRPQGANLTPTEKISNEITNTINEFQEVINTTNAIINEYHKKSQEQQDIKELQFLETEVKKYSDKIKLEEKKKIALEKKERKELEKIISTINNNEKNLKTNKEEVETVSESMKDTLKCYTTVFLNIGKSIGQFSFSIISSVFSFTYSVFSKIFTFFGNIKTYWYQFDNFMNNFGPIWSIAKGLVSMALAPIKWVYNIGKKTLGFIYDSVKALVLPLLKITSYAVTFAFKAPIAIFKWWSKMLMSTLLNPSMWIITIPMFAVITIGLLSALKFVLVGVNNVATKFLIPILTKVFDIFDKAYGWIEDAIVGVYHWIKNQYEGSALQKFVNDSWKTISDMFMDVFGGSETLKNVISWITDAYHWLTKKGSIALDYMRNGIDAVKEFLGNSTFIEKGKEFLEWLYSKIPNFLQEAAGSYIKNKYGWLSEGKFGELKLRVKEAKNLQFQQLLELKISEFKKTKPNATVEQTTGYARDIAINELKKSGYEIDEDKIESVIKSANAAIAAGKIVDKERLAILTADIKRGEYTLEQLKQGKIEFNKIYNKGVIQDLTDRLFKSIYPDENTRLKGKEQEVTYEDVNKMIQEEIEKINRINVEGMVGESQSLIKSAGANVIANVTSGFNLWEAPDWAKKLINTQENDRSKANFGLVKHGELAYEIAQAAAKPIQQKAKGSILQPIMGKTNILPLDSIGRSFIQNKLKDLPTSDIKMTPKEEQIRNITIIEEERQNIESYEIYTIQAMSKGVIEVR